MVFYGLLNIFQKQNILNDIQISDWSHFIHLSYFIVLVLMYIFYYYANLVLIGLQKCKNVISARLNFEQPFEPHSFSENHMFGMMTLHE